MRNLRFLFLCGFPILLSSCERNFGDLFSAAQKAYDEKNYTVVIDNVSLALPRWKEKEGVEKKAEAYQLLGKTYHALKKLDQATDAYREAVKLSDKTYESAYTLGVIYTAGYQHKNAKAAFQDALRMRKDDPLALLGLGDSLFALGQYEEAQALYKRVLEVSPGVPEALKNLDLVSKKLAPPKITPDRSVPPRAAIKAGRVKSRH